MKFTKDGMGWRDLELVASDKEKLQLCIPDRKAKYTPTSKPFVYITDNGEQACAHFSRAQLKTLAKAILKELERK